MLARMLEEGVNFFANVNPQQAKRLLQAASFRKICMGDPIVRQVSPPFLRAYPEKLANWSNQLWLLQGCTCCLARTSSERTPLFTRSLSLSCSLVAAKLVKAALEPLSIRVCGVRCCGDVR